MQDHTMTRRRFLNAGAQTGLIGTLSALGLLGAAAPLHAGPSDYKALVCLYMFGGNDGNNLIVPLDPERYDKYTAIRGGSGLALSTAARTLLPQRRAMLRATTAPVDQPFAFHYGVPELDALYERGQVAAILNVGSLRQPLTKAQYLAGTAIPAQLFSHPDPSPHRLADAASAAIDDGAGQAPVSVEYGIATRLAPGCRQAAPTPGDMTPQQQLLNGMDLVTDLHMPACGAPLSTLFPGYSLAAQLKTVAALIRARATQGPGRQVYFVSLSGFDTHGAQAYQQFDMLRQVSQSLGAFQQALAEIGAQDLVTTFTMSEFGRTLQPNSGGTDHAWGNHHLVVGAAVRGGVYGQFPDFTLGGADDATGRGAWIPQFSNQQFGATLGKWFGAKADLPTKHLFKTELSNFATKDLGFMG